MLCTSTKCPCCHLTTVERHGATPGAQTVLYNPTSQDEGLDTDAPEVDWDNVDWDYATDVDPCIASGDSDCAVRRLLPEKPWRHLSRADTAAGSTSTRRWTRASRRRAPSSPRERGVT